MPGILLHSAADIVRQLLVDMELCVDYVDDKTSWAAFASGEPDLPDDCVTVYDTEGRQHGRDMVVNLREEHEGFQVRVRSRNHQRGFAKAKEIGIAFDQSVSDVQVGLLDEEGDTVSYLVDAITRTGVVLSIGKDAPNSKRNLFTINAIVSLRMLTVAGYPYLTEDGYGWELEDGSGFYLLEL